MKKLIAGLFILSSIVFSKEMLEVKGDNYEVRYFESQQNPIEAVLYYKKSLPNTASSIVEDEGHSSLIVNYSGGDVIGIFVLDKDSTLAIKANPAVYSTPLEVLELPKVKSIYKLHQKTGSVM